MTSQPIAPLNRPKNFTKFIESDKQAPLDGLGDPLSVDLLGWALRVGLVQLLDLLEEVAVD